MAITPESDRVPLRSKVAYGLAGIVGLWSTNLPNQLITPIFVSGLGLSPAIVSTITVIFRLFDAIFDPVIGWLSDNTRTRWGRRKPYLLVGAILTGLTFPLMWFAQGDWSPATISIWLVTMGILFYACFTLWAMPYHSMLLEMTPDYHERTSVSSWASFFGQFATLSIGWAWYIVQLPFFSGGAEPDPITGGQTLSIMAGTLIMGLGVLPVFFVKERFYELASKQKKVRLIDNFRWTFQNRPFVLTVIFTFCFACACSVLGGLGFYIRLYYVLDGDQFEAAKLQGVESTLFLVLGIISIPCFNYLSRIVGKHIALLAAMGLLFFGTLTRWWTFTPENPWLSVLNGALLAPAFTGIWQLIPSINADVVDYDELRTGERREGAFASIYSWVVKASFSVGMGLAGPMVVWSGFVIASAADQEPGTYLNIRMLDISCGLILLVLAICALLKYRLTPERMMEIRLELEKRRGQI